MTSEDLFLGRTHWLKNDQLSYTQKMRLKRQYSLYFSACVHFTFPFPSTHATSMVSSLTIVLSYQGTRHSRKLYPKFIDYPIKDLTGYSYYVYVR